MVDDTKMTREKRLAAKLRENLRRRKAQARAMDGDGHMQDAADDTLSKKPADG